jgi:hypothetical protein
MDQVTTGANTPEKIGVVKCKAETNFKEGNTHFIDMKDLFLKEKGGPALKKLEEKSMAPRVAGGNSKKRKSKEELKASTAKGELKKVLNFSPSKKSVTKSPSKASVGGYKKN